MDSLEDFKSADKTAVKLRNTYLFGRVNNSAAAEAEGVKVPAIIIYNIFDEGKNVFAQNFDANAMEAFIKTAAMPLVGEVSRDTFSGYMDADLPLAYIFAETEEERIDFEARKFPAFVIKDPDNQEYPFDQDSEISYDAIAKFTADYSAGKIEPSILSEPVPETQDGPVTIVVAKSYHDIILDNDKDVLVQFYSPICGHCKILDPKYDDLGRNHASSEHKNNIVIAKVDATKIEFPDQIRGFPTIKLYPAGAKEAPITYEGNRTVEDLISFIQVNGKYKAGVANITEDPSAVRAALRGQ